MLEDTIYTKQKVNNEIELCKVFDSESKTRIEQVLLKNRISYFVRWTKPRLFARRQEHCIFCINNNDTELAHSLIENLCKEKEMEVEFLFTPAQNEFF